MARLSLPPGFRFHPTDVELIKYYLKRKSLGKKLRFDAIAEINIYKYSPWDLPDFSCLKNKDLEWFFFCPISRKYASGSRFGRATETGYWKATGKDRPVTHNEETVGLIKTLIFHQGSAPRGERTDWVMHEYRIMEKELADAGISQAPYVLVKVFKKSGLGPKNGAQYGAPFNEEEWDVDDNDEMEISAETFQPPAATPPSTVANNNAHVYAGTSSASLQATDNSPLSVLTHNNSINQNYDNSLNTTTQSACHLLPAYDNNSIAHNDSYSLDTTSPCANPLLTAHNNSFGTRNGSYSIDTLTPSITAHNNNSGTCNGNYSIDTLTLPLTGHNDSSIVNGPPPVPLLPLPGPSTVMAWANGVVPCVEEVEIDSLLAMFSEDEFPNFPSDFNDVNQVNGEEFIELADIYADLDDLNDWEKLQRLI